MSPLALIALGLLPLAVVLAIGLTGFRNGDRLDDAGLQSVLVRRRTPEGWADYAAITVRNPSTGTAIILARARPIGLLCAAITAEDRRTALRRPRTLADSELLGALDGGCAHTWLLPLPAAERPRMRLDVSIEQASGRTRIHSAILHAPLVAPAAVRAGRRARPPQTSSSLVRDEAVPKDLR